MGWSFSCDRSHDKKALVAELRCPSRYGEHLRLIKSSVVGNHHWYVVERVDTGVRHIGLDLMQSGYPYHGWGYKGLSEDWGPTAYDCPIGFLKLAPPIVAGVDGASEASACNSAAWREKVRTYHASKAARRANPPKVGERVRYGNETYTLLEPRGRKGWRVHDELGDHYRMSCQQVAKAYRLAFLPT